MFCKKALIQTAQSYVVLGKELSTKGCLEEAIASLRKALEFKADYIEAHNLIAQIHTKKENWDDCIQYYREILALNPHNPPAYLALGDALRKVGQSEQSVAICQKAQRQEPTSPGIYRLLGNLMEDDKRLDEAIHYYRKFLELKPDAVWGYVCLARSFQKKGQFRNVHYCCLQAMEHQKVAPDIFRLNANALRRLEKFEPAVDSYRRYLMIKPGNAIAYVELGETLLKAKRSDEVIDCCFQAKQQQKIEPAIYRLLGAAFQQQGLLEGAISNYQTFLKLKPDVGWVYTALGKAFRQQGNLQEAINCFIEAERRGHARQQMNQLIADTYKENGDLDAAVPYYQKVLELKSSNLNIDTNLTPVQNQSSLATSGTGASGNSPKHSEISSPREKVTSQMSSSFGI